MVCTANDLLEWKDFPKGLRVLLLDEDTNSAAQIRSKLEEMEYIVSAFSSEDEALSAISSKNEFHVAILEVNVHNSDGRYKFLEASKDLPTIMMSNEQCLSTMMKCIALGAVEFLIKPLSEDKLRNIWQHVVHKAFNAGGTESLKSVKEFVGSVLEFQQKNIVVTQDQVSQEEPKCIETNPNDEEEEQAICDKFPAPSTPQLKQGGRFLDDGDYQEQTSGSPLKESGDVDVETKSVDTTNGNSATQMEVDPPQTTAETAGIKEESGGCQSSKDEKLSPKSQDEVNGVDNPSVSAENVKNESVAAPNNCGAKGNSRKKAKVDWTPELHKKFVQAVEQLGVDQAIPSRILELMKVEGLTRHNVASHLQKYRMHRRHILPKVTEERRWPHPRDSTTQRNYYQYKAPVMAFPSYLAANNTTAAAAGMQMQAYPAVWAQQSGARPTGFPMWGSHPPPPGYPWQPTHEAWHWHRPYAAPGMHADAWGCPVLPHPPTCAPTFPQVQGGHGFQGADSYGNSPCDVHPGEEVIDKAVKEAISKPWLPLPIGLKSPSTDSVLAELSRQGISTVPPPHHHRQINGRQHHCHR